MSEPRCLSWDAGGETKCSLRDICCSHVLEKGLNEWRGRRGVARAWESSMAVLSPHSLLLARRTHLITTQEGHWEMWCACPHSWWLPLIGAPMAIFLSFDPLLRIPPSTGKQNPNHLIYVATNSREIYPGKATKWTVLSSPFQGCALMPTDTWAIDWTLLSWWLARVCILWIRKQEAQQGMLKYYIPRTRAIRTDSALMGEVLSSLLKTFNQYTVVQHTDVSTSVKAF